MRDTMCPDTLAPSHSLFGLGEMGPVAAVFGYKKIQKYLYLMNTLIFGKYYQMLASYSLCRHMQFYSMTCHTNPSCILKSNNDPK